MNLSVDNLGNAVENQAVGCLLSSSVRTELSDLPRGPSPTFVCWERLRFPAKGYEPCPDMFGNPWSHGCWPSTGWFRSAARGCTRSQKRTWLTMITRVVTATT